MPCSRRRESGSSSRRGPNLPYSFVAGVTPCRGGWLVASASCRARSLRRGPGPHGHLHRRRRPAPGLFDDCPERSRGRSDHAHAGGRTCDREARALLGRAERPSRVRPSTGSQTSELLPDHLDAISRTLLPRYREVAREMAPFRQRTIFEVNPDLSFFQLNGDVPMRWSKHSEKGIQERRALLEEKVPGVLRIIDAEFRERLFAPSRCRGLPLDRRRIFAQAASGSQRTPNGTNRACGWRSFARRGSRSRSPTSFRSIVGEGAQELRSGEHRHRTPRARNTP